MAPFEAQEDDWLADVASYIRNSWGNEAPAITSDYVASLRAASADRKTPWTEAELDALEPPLLANRKEWQLSASHGKGKLGGCVDGDPKSRYDTGTSQAPGMWLQIELPEPAEINRLVLDSTRSAHDHPVGYELMISADGEEWSKPIAEGAGISGRTDIGFPNVQTRFLRVVQTGSKPGKYWSVHELEIYGKVSL